jgi:hypothetical protein
MKTENYSGVGALYEHETQVGRVEYRIRVNTPETELDPKGSSRGTIELLDPSAAVAFANLLRSEGITVVLEDGRRWNCVVSRIDGNVAHVEGYGLLPRS